MTAHLHVRRRAFGTVLLVLGVAVLSACAAGMGAGGDTDAAYRPALDPPTRFVTSDGVPAEDGCRMTMVDPRDQTQLRLARSWLEGVSYRGDYEVPSGRYGVRDGELLRIDCSTGETIGIVRG
jgi:hypothetical protein